MRSINKKINKSGKNQKGMSDFLISSFSPVMVNPLTPWENESLDMDWSKESLGKVRFLQHPLKKILLCRRLYYF